MISFQPCRSTCSFVCGHSLVHHTTSYTCQGPFTPSASTSVDARRRASTDVDALGVNGPSHHLLLLIHHYHIIYAMIMVNHLRASGNFCRRFCSSDGHCASGAELAPLNELDAICIPRTTTKLGMRSFAIAGLVIWNSLPTALRTATLFPLTFARHLKAHLFG